MTCSNNDSKRGSSKFLLIGIIGLVMIGLAYMAIAGTTPSREELQSELDNLTSELNDSGYDWLIDYNISYPSVEVYRENSSEEIARFGEIAGGENGTFKEYKIYLTNLTENESYDVLVNGKIIPFEIWVMKLRIDEIKRGLNKNG